MRFLSRVVWSEGMHLAHHHFQLQRRYIEDSAMFARTSVVFAPWGLTALELDNEALLNGSATVIRASGVLPDGTAFDVSGESAPAPLSVGSLFSPTQTEEVLSLTLPAYREGQANCSAEGAPGDGTLRFRPRRRSVRDEVSGDEEREVTVAQPNFGLALGEVAEGLVALPLARIRRDGSGAFVFDENYIPPSLRIGASPRLGALGRRIVEILDGKVQNGPRSAGGTDDMTSVWLSHAIHSGLAPIRLCVERPSTHPERLFAELVRLAGALCTFSLNAHPRDLPAYRHDALEEVFGELDLHIRRHLEVALPTAREAVKLEAQDESFSTGHIKDARSLRYGKWYLGVKGQVAQAELIGAVPKLVKVCSAKHIKRLVQEAFPGLGMSHDPSPPSGVSPRPGFQYFLLDRTDPCWSSIVDTKEVGVYAPAVLGSPTLELVAVWDADHGG